MAKRPLDYLFDGFKPEALPRTKKEADDADIKYYFTNKPCKNGHIAPRYALGRTCSECGRVKARESWNFPEKPRARRIAKEAGRVCDPGFKLCGRCKNPKPLSEFLSHNRSADGRGYRCESCRAELRRIYYEAHQDEILVKAKQYGEDNRERRSEYNRQYRNDNIAKVLDLQRDWRIRNPGWSTKAYRKDTGRGLAKTRKHQAAKLRALPPWADLEKIESVYVEAARLTEETGIKHQVDHQIPLQGKNVCGLHVHYNLEILTAVENMAKKNRTPEEYEAFKKKVAWNRLAPGQQLDFLL